MFQDRIGHFILLISEEKIAENWVRKPFSVSILAELVSVVQKQKYPWRPKLQTSQSAQKIKLLNLANSCDTWSQRKGIIKHWSGLGYLHDSFLVFSFHGASGNTLLFLFLFLFELSIIGLICCSPVKYVVLNLLFNEGKNVTFSIKSKRESYIFTLQHGGKLWLFPKKGCGKLDFTAEKVRQALSFALSVFISVRRSNT
jgi:hypothetical protein